MPCAPSITKSGFSGPEMCGSAGLLFQRKEEHAVLLVPTMSLLSHGSMQNLGWRPASLGRADVVLPAVCFLQRGRLVDTPPKHLHAEEMQQGVVSSQGGEEGKRGRMLEEMVEQVVLCCMPVKHLSIRSRGVKELFFES